MIWILIAVMVAGLIGLGCFDAGVIVGERRAENNRRARLGSMQRHPSNHIRPVRDGGSILSYNNLPTKGESQ